MTVLNVYNVINTMLVIGGGCRKTRHPFFSVAVFTAKNRKNPQKTVLPFSPPVY